MINVALWFAVGVLVGWLVGRTIGSAHGADLVVDALAGAGGAMLIGGLVPSLVGMGALNAADFNPPALAGALLGAMLLPAVIGFIRHLVQRQVV